MKIGTGSMPMLSLQYPAETTFTFNLLIYRTLFQKQVEEGGQKAMSF